MVKITVSGKPDETQKTLDYLKNLEKIGEIMVTKTKTTQIPPVYSAIKINGIKSCDLIRKKNIYTELKPREVKIYNIEIISDIYKYENYSCVDIKMLVSKGFYVRSFVRDLSNILNIPSVLKDLCRTKNGNYNLEKAKKIEEFQLNDIIDIETFLKNS